MLVNFFQNILKGSALLFVDIRVRSGSRVRRVLERHRRHLETPGPGKSQICQGIQANQMHLAPEELLRLIELVVICQIPGWTFLLGYFLAKR